MSGLLENDPWWTGAPPYDVNVSTPIANTNRHEFQRGRFTNSSDLVSYACTMGGGALPPHLMDYYPVCEWPYINKGWMNDGVEGFDDVVFNDCSITIAQAVGPAYDSLCLSYSIISIIPFFIILYYLKVINEASKKKRPRFYFPYPNPNQTEKVLVLTMTEAFATSIFCLDLLGFKGLWGTGKAGPIVWAMIMGVMGACPGHLLIMLVTSWITIIDGGKTMLTPTWAKNLGRFSYITWWLMEIVGSALERTTGEASKYTFAVNLQIVAPKFALGGLIIGIYNVLMLVYGRKISAQLKSGVATEGCCKKN